MIFNLNEQKVLSDPSGSSVFKGEKDFNDIVVNLPNTIDGHTATQLNYVMHFVDSDGGYSTKILNVDSSGETLKATATVSTSITSKAQAFYAYVLMTDDEETVIGKTNGVIVMIHPVPDEENEIIPPADADKIIKGLEEIVKEATETIEEAAEAIGSKQDKLTAGQNITISDDNVISAEGGGVTSYNDLTDKPQINGVTLSGNKTSSNLGLQSELTAGENISIVNGEISSMSGDLYIRNDDSSMDFFPIIGGSWLVDSHSFTAGYDPYTPTQKRLSLGNYVLKFGESIYLSSISDVNNLSINRIYVINGGELDFLPPNSKGGLIINVGGYGDYNTQIVINTKNYIYLRRATVSDTTHVWRNISTVILSGVVNNNGTITFTDSNGNTFTTTGSSVIGPQGDDYVLTAQDKSDIADIVLSELPTTQGVLYGNQSN